MRDIKNYSLPELEFFFSKRNLPPFRARQVFNWIYKRGRVSFSAMHNVPKSVRNLLAVEFYCSGLEIKKELVSIDRTHKFIINLDSNSVIETALIPQNNRATLCVSTQVGCRFGCHFCVSGRLGFRRNLSPAEIINQYLAVADRIRPAPITHIVFMGIGEPLDNFANLVKAIDNLTNAKAVGFSPRKITVSSCGILPQLNKLFELDLGIKFSLSLHAAIDSKRSRLMPVNRQYPLAQVMKAIKRDYHHHRRSVTFEYLLIKDFNGHAEDAAALSRLLRGIKYNLNIIPYNYSPYFEWQSPSPQEIDFFKKQLVERGIFFTLRKPRGRDINAACGQLTINDEDES